jgi:DNA-binding transcriptional LysR family regulator
MELRQLRHLLEVVRTSSFRRAADGLGLTQPALSKSIKKLEDELGVELLERGPNGAVVTPYGQVLSEYAQSIEAEIERVTSEIAAMKGAGGGSVRVGVSTALMRFLIADVVRAMLDVHGGVGVRIVEGLQTELLSALRRGVVDIVVSGAGQRIEDPDISQKTLCRVRIGLVCAETHPLATARSVGLADLAPYRWILPGLGEQEEVRLTEALNRAGLPKPAIAIRVSSSLSMAALLRGSSLVSYLPLQLMRADPAYAGIVSLPGALFEDDAAITLSYRRRAVMLPATRLFMTELTERASRVA